MTHRSPPTCDGWVGSASELEHFLRTASADRNEQGKFIILNQGITSFMGAGEEVVVSSEAEYVVRGQRRNLVQGLRSTSYGFAVKVF